VIPSGFVAILKLFATDSTTLVGTAGSKADAVLLARATLSGTYLVSVAGQQNGTGAYAVQVTDIGLDDHGDSPATATMIAPDGSQEGSLQFRGDVDWLSIPTAEGHSYRVTVTPLEFTASARLVGPDGQTELGAQASSSPMAFPFSATASAPYFVAVSTYPYVTGSYRVEVEDLGLTQ
jgi:hypothetical protein